MLGRLTSRLLFLFHFVRLKVCPEVYEAFSANGMPYRLPHNRQCRQCKMRGGHRSSCRKNPYYRNLGNQRW